MPPYRQRNIDAPEGEWLTDEEAAAYLGLETKEFLSRVLLGALPPDGTAKKNLRERHWSWQWVQAISWLRSWLDQLYEQKKRESLEKQRAEKRAARKARRGLQDGGSVSS